MSGKHPRPGSASEAAGTGKIIAGRYRIQRMIAHGGMGVVYLAEHIELGRLVALKILKHHHDPDNAGAFQERFTLEARTLGNLDHPNIVTLYDYGRTEDNRFFLALEFIDGPRFTDLIRSRQLKPERAVRLLLQVCRALRYSHRRGVIHRDLKPSNLLIYTDDDGRDNVKVVDFGLVKVLEDDQSLTQAGLILGSPHCMSPEQVKGLSVDERTDIYAIGVLLFRAVTGTWPFHGESSTATMIAHINEPIPRFASVAGELMVPPGLEEIVSRCLAKEPDDRYPEVGALMQDLQACLRISPEEYQSTTHLSSASLLSPEPITELHPRKNNSLPLLVAALLFLLVVISAGSWVLSRALLQGEPELTRTAPVAAPVADPVAEPAAEPPAEPVADPAVAAPIEEDRTPVVQNPRPRSPRINPQPRQETEPAEPGSDNDPAGAPSEQPVEENDAPDGYMGLPDDLDF